MFNYQDKMTDAMLKVCNNFINQMEEECLFCQQKLKEANNAGNISLPHVNERDVSVVHGARLEIYRVQDYWWNRLYNAMNFVSREFQIKHELHDRDIE